VEPLPEISASGNVGLPRIGTVVVERATLSLLLVVPGWFTGPASPSPDGDEELTSGNASPATS
jgi:hypothetical protein